MKPKPKTTRYLVERIHAGLRDETYADATTPHEAARAASRGIYRDLRVYADGDGQDLNGEYLKFTARVPGGGFAVFRVRTPKPFTMASPNGFDDLDHP